jgi:phosphatidylserine decarboxylase
MTFIESIKKDLAPIHPAGYPFIGLFALAAILLFWVAKPLGWIGVLATAWCAYFFRDPVRVVPVGEGFVVSPADGRISQVALALPPPELEMGPEQRVRISIFMNVFDVHVNRAPMAGEVRRIVYRAGKFINADLDKASEDNERNSLLLRTSAGPVAVVQIAGVVARRIICFVREGASVAAGERIGLIRFGSRVDVYLPAGVKPLVSEGQTALAGETVLADISATSRTLTFRND